MLLFDDVELLDFAGPYEVFSAANFVADQPLFQVSTISPATPIATSRNGISVNTEYRLDDAPVTEILFLPGGVGARRLVDEGRVIDWVKKHADDAELVLSVCTGALLLAKAGLLAGLQATTHHSRLELLKELEPTAVVDPQKRFVDNGKFVLSAGISAGIDMSLHIVERLGGTMLASRTVEYMEYSWNRNQGK